MTLGPETYGLGALLLSLASAFMSGKIVLGKAYDELKERCEREVKAERAEKYAYQRALLRLKGIVLNELGHPVADEEQR